MLDTAVIVSCEQTASVHAVAIGLMCVVLIKLHRLSVAAGYR